MLFADLNMYAYILSIHTMICQIYFEFLDKYFNLFSSNYSYLHL